MSGYCQVGTVQVCFTATNGDTPFSFYKLIHSCFVHSLPSSVMWIGCVTLGVLWEGCVTPGVLWKGCVTPGVLWEGCVTAAHLSWNIRIPQ